MSAPERFSDYANRFNESIAHARRIFEPVLRELNLGEDQLKQQDIEELETSLSTIRHAISKPESFGLLHLRFSASAGIVLTEAKQEAHMEIGIMPLLLERERMIVSRLQFLKEKRTITSVRDAVVHLVKDESTKNTLLQELTQLENQARHHAEEKIKPRPRVFIGSSSEGLSIAEYIQLGLDNAAECTIWTQGVFGFGLANLENLIMKAPTFEYAVLVLTPDDMVTKREKSGAMPRDNVLFELGLFMGALGRERAIMVYCRDDKLEMPSDLSGISAATFKKRADGNLSAALGPVCTQLKGFMDL